MVLSAQEMRSCSLRALCANGERVGPTPIPGPRRFQAPSPNLTHHDPLHAGLDQRPFDDADGRSVRALRRCRMSFDLSRRKFTRSAAQQGFAQNLSSDFVIPGLRGTRRARNPGATSCVFASGFRAHPPSLCELRRMPRNDDRSQPEKFGQPRSLALITVTASGHSIANAGSSQRTPVAASGA